MVKNIARCVVFCVLALSPALIGAFENVQIALEIGAPDKDILKGPSSIDFDENGRVYVADTLNCRVRVFNTNGSMAIEWGSRGKAEGQFLEPFGISYHDGQVFVTDSKLDRVEVFSAAGKFQYQFGGSGSGPGRLKDPKGIEVSGQGRVYVAENGSARVSVFTTQGLYLGAIGAVESGSSELKAPVYIALDRSGNLYVSDASLNRIQVYSAEGKALRAIDGKALGIQKISGIAVTERGYLLVADMAGRIFLLDASGKGDNPFGSPGSGRGQFKEIGGLALGDDGRLAVADMANNRVVVLKASYPESAPVLAAERSLPRAVMESPIATPARDVAIGSNGLIFALNLQGAGVTAYTRQGALKFAIKPEVEGKGSRIAAGGGRVYVSDSQNNNVTAYNAEDGKLLFRFGSRGKGPGQLESPGGMAVSGKLYIADTGNDRVQVFSLDGVYLSALSDASAPFKKPTDVTVGPDGRIYVADAGNKRIVRFKAGGKLDGIIGDKEMFKSIIALRVDEDGRIYALEGAGEERIRVFTPDGKVFMRLGSRGSGPADFTDPGGMDFYRGAFYIADTGNSRVLRMTLMDVPSEPAGLKVATGPDNSLLTWKKGAESFIQGYRIYALDESGKRESIGDTDQAEFTVSYPLKNGQTRFTVTAFSRDGLESTAAPTVTDWARIGLGQLQAGKPKEALPAFEKALEIDPNDPFALEQMGRALVALKEYDQAKVTFGKLLPNRNYAEKGLLGLGITAFEQGQDDEAEKQLLKSIGYNSQNGETNRYLAEIYAKQRHWQKALEYAHEASALDPQNPRPHELMGLAYFNMFLYGKAAKSFSMAISLQPNNMDVYIELARVYRVQGQNDPAEEMLKKAIGVANGSVLPQLELGTLYLETGKLDEADAEVDAVLKSNPENAAAYRLKGKIFFARGKKEDAIEAFQKALSLEPNDPDALVSLTMAYLNLGQTAEAANIIDRAKSIHPKNEAVLMASAKVRQAQADLNAAMTDLEAAVAVNPESTEALLAMGRIHLQRKEYQAAADDFSKASKLMPGAVEPLLLLAEALSGANRQVEAEDALREALNINMESGPAHYALGELYASRTEYEKAIPELKLAAFIEPDNPKYHHALGNAYVETSDVEEAVQSLKRATELAPNDEGMKRDLNLALEALKKYRASGNVPPVEISRVQVNPIFMSIYKSYQDSPMGTVVLKNNGKEPIFKIKISFRIKGYMEQPTNQVVDSLKPRATVEIPLKANLGEKALAVKEDTPALGIVTVEYVRGKSPQKLTTSVPFTLYGPNAIIWSDKAMVGAFVTQADWTVAEFARGALEAAGDQPDSLPDSLFKSIAVYEALVAYKMSYLEDPNNPYRQSSREVERVDYIQYPRDTLRLRSGDCDDLSVLFLSLLENLGVETAMADMPGHVLALIDAGPAGDDSATAGDKELFVEVEGRLWIPVEMTVVGSGFSEAWAQGAMACRKAMEEGKFGLISVHEAWKKYAPATLPVTNWKPTMPDQQEMAKLIGAEVTQISRKRIDLLAAELSKKLEQNPNDPVLMNELGVLYARNGDMERAKEYFEKVVAADPNNVFALNNIGNIMFFQENYQAALEKYRAAETISPNDAEIKMNLAMTYYRLGNMDMAKEKFEQGAEADPDVAAANETLKELIYH